MDSSWISGGSIDKMAPPPSSLASAVLPSLPSTSPFDNNHQPSSTPIFNKPTVQASQLEKIKLGNKL
jgi:hypothetical protein